MVWPGCVRYSSLNLRSQSWLREARTIAASCWFAGSIVTRHLGSFQAITLNHIVKSFLECRCWAYVCASSCHQMHSKPHRPRTLFDFSKKEAVERTCCGMLKSGIVFSAPKVWQLAEHQKPPSEAGFRASLVTHLCITFSVCGYASFKWCMNGATIIT